MKQWLQKIVLLISAVVFLSGGVSAFATGALPVNLWSAGGFILLIIVFTGAVYAVFYRREWGRGYIRFCAIIPLIYIGYILSQERYSDDASLHMYAFDVLLCGLLFLVARFPIIDESGTDDEQSGTHE